MLFPSAGQGALLAKQHLTGVTRMQGSTGTYRDFLYMIS